MKDHGLEILLLKLGLLSAAAPQLSESFFTIAGDVPFFHVSISTLGMAAAGSMIAFTYGKPVESRKLLFGLAISGTFIGVWGVKVLPRLFGWEWYIAEEMAPPIAGFIALLSRWIMPLVIDALPAIARWFANRSSNTGDKP